MRIDQNVLTAQKCPHSAGFQQKLVLQMIERHVRAHTQFYSFTTLIVEEVIVVLLSFQYELR